MATVLRRVGIAPGPSRGVHFLSHHATGRNPGVTESGRRGNGRAGARAAQTTAPPAKPSAPAGLLRGTVTATPHSL
ncbi:hypothetical protein GCM10022630_30840 [Thermobifida alba]